MRALHATGYLEKISKQRGKAGAGGGFPE
jgi:hypothetical protein